jgi:AraC family transcriptional regulator of adaptative response/methylated-DNA-[protein]-cysteine methyltransferase
MNETCPDLHPNMATPTLSAPTRCSVQTDPRWQQVLARAPQADGQFFYAVRTTGIYCRPSCAARTPRPENVCFFDTPAAAEHAGFRPCKRCRPDQAAGATPLAETQVARVAQLCRAIESAQTRLSLADLAALAGWSPFHLHRIFKAVTGLTPHAYAAAHRAQALPVSLQREAHITTAFQAAGYASSAHFYAASNAVLGMTPKRYRAGGTGLDIRFAVGECSLGAILVAGSTLGICAIFLGDDPEALIHDLQDRFPQAELIGAEAGFEQWVASVVGFVEAPHIGLNLPLDIRGTAFQQRVWQALREIPPGVTASYTDIAHGIGAPSAVRAVASACAANVLALAIPCHRVIRTDGSLSGYRWGVERKRALLDREAAQTPLRPTPPT